MKAQALKSPRAEFLQSPMAITGAILAMGVIRLHEKNFLEESVIQCGDKDRDLLAKNKLHTHQTKAKSPD